MQTNEIDILDLRGLKCPLPVLKIRKVLKENSKGKKIWVQCDDPLGIIDIPNFCNECNQKLLEQKNDEGDSYWFLIERNSDITN